MALVLHVTDGQRDWSPFEHPLTHTLVILGKGMTYDGADSITNTGSDMIGVGAGSFAAWIHPVGWGEANLGTIFNNGQTAAFLSNTGRVNFVSDGVTVVQSAAGSILLNAWRRVFITRDAAGIANIYINGELSGGADQDSGTPVVGDNNVIIGNKATIALTFDGTIDDIKFFDEELSADHAFLDYERTKKFY